MNYSARFFNWWTPVKVGVTLTVAVILGFCYMAFQTNCIILDTNVLECRNNWARFLTSKPNEIGDTLAGFAGTLAFVWIVVTVWVQGYELQEQRKELELTRKELKSAREAQEKQLEVMQKQAEIFEDEQVDRKHDRVKRKLDEMLQSLLSEIEFERNIDGHFIPSLGEPVMTELHVFHRLNQEGLEGSALDEKLRDASRNAFIAFRNFKSLVEQDAISVQLSSKKNYYQYIANKTNEVLKLHEELSADQQVRLESIGVKSMQASLQEIVSLPFWSETP